MSIHIPRRNLHKPTHFMAIMPRLWRTRFFRSINSHSLRNFQLTFILEGILSQFFLKHCHDSVEKSIFNISVGNTRISNCFVGPMSGQNWYVTDCDLNLANLSRTLTSPTIGQTNDTDIMSFFLPTESIHNPRKKWHGPKHSWMFTIRWQQDCHVTFCPSRNYHGNASLWRSIFIVSVGGIKKSNYTQPSCEYPELKFQWLWLEWSHQLVKSLHSTNCWTTCLWNRSGKLVAIVTLLSTLQPLYLPRKLLYFFMHCRGTTEMSFHVLLDWNHLHFFNWRSSFWKIFDLSQTCNSSLLKQHGNLFWISHKKLFHFGFTRLKKKICKTIIVSATDLPATGLPSTRSNFFSNATCGLSVHTIRMRYHLRHAPMWIIRGSNLAYTFGLNSTHNNIRQLA